MKSLSRSALSQSGEISPDFCCFYGGGIRHNEDIMHSFQNFIVRLIPNHPPPSRNKDMEISCESAGHDIQLFPTATSVCQCRHSKVKSTQNHKISRCLDDINRTSKYASSEAPSSRVIAKALN